MIIYENNKICYISLSIILLLFSFVSVNNGYKKTANEILNENFNHELFQQHQLEKEFKTQQLVQEDPDMYSEWVGIPIVNDYSYDYDRFGGDKKIDMVVYDSDSAISSGSAQNYWYGQTCEATIFNNTKTTSCPNDCFSYWGQGQCNETTSTCVCNYFFIGDDCSENVDPDHNWDIMNCNGGRYCPPVYNTPSPRYCICPPGQTGLECTVCQNSAGCQSLTGNYSSDYECNSSPYAYYKKSYSCFVTSEEVNSDLNNSTASSAIDCEFPGGSYNTQTGFCSMNLYYKIQGSPLYFNCSFTECDRTILPGQNQSIVCQNSVCNCTTYCGFILDGLISQVTGQATFECGGQTNSDGTSNCVFTQYTISAMIPTIPLKCVTGECIETTPPIYPVPVATVGFLYIYVGSGVGFVGLTLLVGAIFLIFSLQEHRKNFKEDTHLVCELSFHNISCYVNERSGFFGKDKKRKQILDNVNGVCPPGQLTALMGLSGSGKTSLLDILSGRKNVGNLDGKVLINGAPVGKNFKRISGYVTQDDIQIGTLTCREHLMFAALLKLPENMSLETKQQRVASVLEELGLTRVADNPIGTSEKRGISGGERRRLSIATELIVDPSILFIDEPTSGLDSHSASELITKLKQLANNSTKGQRTIIFSIHQPSAELFEQFDNLILLHQGNPYFSGKREDSVNYFIRQKIAGMTEFEKQNYRMHLKNPADFIISMVTDKNCQRFNSNYVDSRAASPFYQSGSPALSSNSNTSDINLNHHGVIENPHNQNQQRHHQHHRHIYGINAPPIDNNDSDSDSDERDHLLASGSIKDSSLEKHNNDDIEVMEGHHNQGEPLASHVKIGKVEEYATSFWTQFFVVCRRSLLNYMRNPFLLRTTYFVHIFVGLTLGYLFWKLPANLEPGCQNRFGAMFFMTALLSFGSITSLDLFYNDRIIFIRERANGFYRTSAYFLAKVVTDIIPMRVIPPIILGSICYYMIGLRPGILHFIYFLISLVLTSTVASSMCMAISTISPTFGTANMVSILLLFVFLLFDGFLLARSSIPKYLVGLVWISFMSYGLEIPVVNEFDGLWIQYNPPNTRPTYADGMEFLSTIGADPNRLFTDMYVLLGMIVGYLLLAYIFLRFLVREYR
ncbi:hypothetical protein RB653_006223 [Dictyostelium firmibasis]|uniref:ABC transporter domain-containing protein n=1 Tax=Dictyostelium firmibasis TaxID=79012 RepID=A0AAN7U2D7_9MYCE